MKPIWGLLACVVLAGCAPPGCYYPTGDFTHYVCPAKQAAARAQAQAALEAQKRQALITKLGGEANYRAYEARLAAKQRAQDWNVQYSACLSQMPVPVSSYQNNWEQEHCGKQADWIMDHAR